LAKQIFLQPNDEIGIITMGEETSDFDEIENIKMYSECLLIPNWEMVKYINNLQSTNYPSNWIEGLYASMKYIKKEVMLVFNKYILLLVLMNNYN
jgi:hypothetical protein